MCYFKWFALLFFLMISFSCRSDNDIIAEMNSGRITRSEFHNWLRDRDINPEEIYKKPEETENQLKQMAVEFLSVEAAVSVKFNTTSFYKNISRAVYANFLSSYYKSEIIKNLSFTETAAEFKIIKLYFPDDLNSRYNREIFSDKIALAEHLIRQEKNGVRFEELIMKYSEEKPDSTSDKSYIVPLLILDKEIFEKIKNLQDESCVSEPVFQKNSILIVKFIRWHSITKDNAYRIISDKRIYDKYIEHLSEGTIEYIIAENGADLTIVSNIERARFINLNELLFSINGKSFTTGELSEILSLLIFLKSDDRESAIRSEEKKNIALNILNEEVFSHIAEKKGISDNKEFRSKWEAVSKSTLAGAYKYYILAGQSMDSKVFSHSDNKTAETRKKEWENNLLNLNNFVINRQVLY